MIDTLKQSFDTRKPTKQEWGVAIGIFVFLFFCFQYIDFESLTIWSTNFWVVIFNGRGLGDFFAYTAENHHNLFHPYMGADIFYIVPWSIWNLPIAIIHYYLNVDILTNSLMMAWSRLFLVAALMVTLFYTYKISMIVIRDHVKSMWAIFLTFTSFFVYSGIFYAGQGDIVVACFTVIGVYYMLTGNMRLFILYFAISIAVKPFSLFIYIPLLLLKEKNAVRVAISLISVLSITIISRSISYFMPGYAESMQNSAYEIIFNNIIGNTFILSSIPVPFFVIAYAVVCVLCYFVVKPKTNDELADYSIYFTTATYLLFFVLTTYEIYRAIYLVPFLYIMIMKRDNLIKYNILLETLSQLFFFSSSYTIFKWFYHPQLLRNSIYLKIFGLPDDLPSIPVFETASLNQHIVADFLLGLFCICAIGIIILNYPTLKLNMRKKECGNIIIWARLGVFIPFVLYTFYRYANIYL